MSEVILGAKVGRLQARVERLEAFVREYARCPCCDDERRCYPECEYLENQPREHSLMVEARKALYGEEAKSE